MGRCALSADPQVREPSRLGDGPRRRDVRAAGGAPLSVSGGAGAPEHCPPAVDAGADAVLAASILHFGDTTIGAIKEELARAGHEVR